MKAIMVMYDSLNRRMLEPYGCDWIPTPNFRRLARRAVTFDCNYVGSMPCMPARRELHTGRYNFQHRSWGPMEPFDDSMPELLKQHGIYTHLATDHQHYWEDGGGTYHTRYSSFEFSRGQEGDPWKAYPDTLQAQRKKQSYPGLNYHDIANRRYLDCEEKMPQAVTFRAGLEFLENNHEEDNFFLQIETFDPHEPFFTQEEYKKQFAHEYDGPMGDWPPYYFVTEGEDSVRHMRMEYAALITMCDRYLGKVLDVMDQYDMWKDTMLIVNTDHGYLLGEHGWWSKSIMPYYEEIARTPLFIYDPRSKVCAERRSQLTQTIDLPATILEFFGIPLPKDMQGRPLRPVIENNEKVHDYVLFGSHEGHCNLTDGRFVYMKAPVEGSECYDYTLMPTHMRCRFSPEELQDLSLQEPFSFTKGCRTMKIKCSAQGMTDPVNFGTKLYDLAADPGQETPLKDADKETQLANEMIRLMHENDCPVDWLKRFGFPAQGGVEKEDILRLRRGEREDRIPEHLKQFNWEPGAVNMYHAVKRFLPQETLPHAETALMAVLEEQHRAQQELSGKAEEATATYTLTPSVILKWIDSIFPVEQLPMIHYFVLLCGRTE